MKKYQQYAFRLQNRDGSLSTEWFRGRGDEDDINRRIKTTGHILEWLCYSLERRGAARAADDSGRHLPGQPDVLATTTTSGKSGPMCHATHALLLYDERVFQPYDKEGEMAVVSAEARRSRRRTRRRCAQRCSRASGRAIASAEASHGLQRRRSSHAF